MERLQVMYILFFHFKNLRFVYILVLMDVTKFKLNILASPLC
uniref:Uncharacterized protein n=1 Tax=Arundo donax TaxID=35708 RepID=A0A0A9FHK0_ARUDO